MVRSRHRPPSKPVSLLSDANPSPEIAPRVAPGRERRHIAIPDAIQLAVWLCLIFLAVRLAYAWSFSTYSEYDDEGYLAANLSSYFNGMPLPSTA
jgi:hypothetical protein